VRNENGILVKRKNINSRFSIDKNKNIFRVEFYKGKKFSGMILVNFSTSANKKSIGTNNKDLKRISSSRL